MSAYYNMTAIETATHFGTYLTEINKLSGGLVMNSMIGVIAGVMFLSMMSNGESFENALIATSWVALIIVSLSIAVNLMGFYMIVIPITGLLVGFLFKSR